MERCYAKWAPGCCATSFEQWDNSYARQFKTVIDMMTHALRIKEDAYSNMFNEQAKTVRETKESLENSQRLVNEQMQGQIKMLIHSFC